MDRRGQSASFDIALVLLAIALFAAIVPGFLGGSGEKLMEARARDDFTQSLLVSMLCCSATEEGYENKTLSDLLVLYFQDPGLNESLEKEIRKHMDLYESGRGLEWVLYANRTRLLWIPEGKVLAGKEISSASAELMLPENKTERVYLFIKWDQLP